MATNTKQPFIYTQAHKMLGDQPTGNTTISNVGVTKLVVATTYTLQNPYVGAMKDDLSHGRSYDSKHKHLTPNGWGV